MIPKFLLRSASIAMLFHGCSNADFTTKSFKSERASASSIKTAEAAGDAAAEPAGSQSHAEGTFRPGAGEGTQYKEAATIANDITGAWLTMYPGVQPMQAAIEIERLDEKVGLRMPLKADSELIAGLPDGIGLFYKLVRDEKIILGFVASKDLSIVDGELSYNTTEVGIYQIGKLAGDEPNREGRSVELPIVSWSAEPGPVDATVLLSAETQGDCQKLKTFAVYAKTESRQACPTTIAEDEIWSIMLDSAVDKERFSKTISGLTSTTQSYLGCIYNSLGNLAPWDDSLRQTEAKILDTNVFGEVDDGMSQGLTAQVYILPKGTEKLPDYSKLDAPIVNLLMSKVDVSDRDFKEGFPGFEDVYEWFSLLIRGELLIKEDCKCRFRVTSDDGSKLFIDGKLVVNHDGNHSFTSKSNTVELKAGLHSLRLEYYQGPRYRLGLRLELDPTGTGKSYRVIPAELLFRPRAEQAMDGI